MNVSGGGCPDVPWLAGKMLGQPRLAFINADWRDFQNTPAMAETHKGGILIDDYLEILNKTGWYHTHIIQAPLSSQRFSAGVVSAMQKKNI